MSIEQSGHTLKEVSTASSSKVKNFRREDIQGSGLSVAMVVMAIENFLTALQLAKYSHLEYLARLSLQPLSLVLLLVLPIPSGETKAKRP